MYVIILLHHYIAVSTLALFYWLKIPTISSNPFYTIFVHPQQLKELNAGSTDIPILSNEQNELEYNIKIDPSGPYVLLIEYVTPVNRTDLDARQEFDASNSTNVFIPKGVVIVRFKSGDGPESNAIVTLNECPYTTPCRQAVFDDLANVYIFNVQDPNNVVYMEVSNVNPNICNYF